MKSEDKSLKSNPPRKMALMIVSIIVLFGGAILLYSSVISTIKTAKQNALQQGKDTKYDLIWTQLELSLEESYASANVAAQRIESDIKTEFDLDELKDALDRKDEIATRNLTTLLAKNIENVTLNNIHNHRNSVMIMSGDGTILEDYTVDLSSKVPAGEKIDKYLETAYNKDLLSTAIRRLKVHSNYIIATENIDYTGNENHIKLSEVNYDTLREVYYSEGLAGLQNYEFMTPVYITDTGDIFGTKDIVSGVPQENHKFIVIQTFNLYDQIMRNNYDYVDDDYETPINTRYDEIINTMYIFGIILIIAVASCILYMMSVYNFITDRYEIEHDSMTT